MEMAFVLGVIAVMLIFGAFGRYVAAEKNRDPGEGFLLGLLFGPLGVLVEACLPNIPPPATPAPPSSAEIALMRRQEADRQSEKEKAAAALADFRRRKEAILQRYNERIAAEKAERHSQRRAERDKAYRALGIEPGPWAWYKALSEVKQAIVLGLAFAVPAGVILIIIFLALLPFGGR
jgi:hypothetical protein